MVKEYRLTISRKHRSVLRLSNSVAAFREVELLRSSRKRQHEL